MDWRGGGAGGQRARRLGARTLHDGAGQARGRCGAGGVPVAGSKDSKTAPWAWGSRSTRLMYSAPRTRKGRL